MNWQSLAIIGIIVVLFIILMIINASATDLDDTSEDDTSCSSKLKDETQKTKKIINRKAPKIQIPAKKSPKK